MTAQTSAVRLHPVNRNRLYLLALMGLAAGVRLYFSTYTRVVWGDEPFYLWLGRSLWAGGGYKIFGYSGAHFPPLFPVIAGGLSYLTGGLYQASNLLYILCGALLVLPLYGIAKEIYGRPAARATALIVAVYPALTTGLLAWGTLTEPLYLLAVSSALFWLVRGSSRSRTRDYVLFAFGLGLAYLTRTEALVFMLIGLPLLFGLRIVQGDRWRIVLGRAVLASAVFLLTAAPYVLYLHRNTGEWSLTGAAGMAYVSMEGLAADRPAAFDAATWGLDPASNEVYLFAPASETQGLLAAIMSDPGDFLARLRANARDLGSLLVSTRLVPWPVVVLIVLGLFGRAWSSSRLRGELALLASAAGPLSYVPFFIQDRYLAGLLIPAILWAGLGAYYVGQWLADTANRLQVGQRLAPPRSCFIALPALLIASVLLWQAPRLWATMQRTNSFQRGHLAAAAELNRLGVPADTVVMSRYPAIAFHAGTRWTPTPAATWPEIAAYARRHGAGYLVVDAWEIKLRPQMTALLDPAAAPAELEYVTTEDSGAGPVVIYRLRP